MSADNYPVNQVDAGERRRRIFPPPWTWAILVSALAWLVIFITIPPGRQNFPLGDDWAFAHGVIWFAHGQGIHYSTSASMPQLGQWLWSIPFLSTTSLAHVALRVSVIILSWLGLVAFYDLLRQGGISARLSALATCVLALDPLFFVLQGTYMTDVPALSFGLVALSCYARALGQKNVRWLGGAAGVAILAVITRQTMLTVPVAAGVLMLRDREIRWKPVWLLSVAIPAAVCLYTAWWFSHRWDVLSMKPGLSLAEVLFRPFLAIQLCGLVILPLGLMVPFPKKRHLLPVCLLVVLAAATGVCYFYQNLPYGGMFPYCTGMLSLSGTYSSGLVMGERDILLTQPLRALLTVLGCLGAAQILAVLAERVRTRKFPGILTWFTFLQFLSILVMPGVMDRYLAVLFPGAIYLIATRCSASYSRWSAAVATAGLCGLVSMALFHDWLSWNSPRWELGRQAVAVRAIRPIDIEGGFEWNGWYSCREPGSPPPVPGGGPTNAPLKLWFSQFFFPDVTGKYALSFTLMTNTVAVASQPYTRWLPPGHLTFYLLKPAP